MSFKLWPVMEATPCLCLWPRSVSDGLGSPSLVPTGRSAYSIVKAIDIRGKGSSLFSSSQPHLLISCLGTSFAWPLLPSCWSSGLETAQPVVSSPFWSIYLCDWIEVTDFLLQKKKSMAIPTNIYSEFQGSFWFPYLSNLYSSLLFSNHICSKIFSDSSLSIK